jgi:hypothetical protein
VAKSLNKLLRARPSGAEVNALMKEIKTDGPRGAAMVAAAIIDDVLVGAIRYKFVTLKKDEDEALFGPDRPLGSFSSRIKVAYALGIYGPKTQHDLETLREIRNAFAHGRRQLSFETKEVAEMCKGLHCIKDIEGYKTLSGRALFNGAVELLMLYLTTKIGPYPPGIERITIEGITQLD